MDEFDRILGSEPVIRPTAGFAARVMSAVRDEAVAPEPIAFPWKRFLPGAIAGLAVLVVAVVGALISAPPAMTTDPAAALLAIDGRMWRDIGIVAGALLLPGIVALRVLRAGSSVGIRF